MIVCHDHNLLVDPLYCVCYSFNTAVVFFSAIKYKIQVFTGKEPNAEPDSEARFYIQLYGSRGDSGRRWLFKSLNHDEWFLPNQVDEFEIEAVSLDEIKEVKMGHDTEDTGVYLQECSM